MVTQQRIILQTRLSGNGSAALSDRTSTQDVMFVGNLHTAQTTNILQIMNYANATTFKTVLCRSNQAGAQVSARVGLWRKTPEAISTILVRPSGGANFSIGCQFTLYGIEAA
jgi:hypothetical protein